MYIVIAAILEGLYKIILFYPSIYDAIIKSYEVHVPVCLPVSLPEELNGVTAHCSACSKDRILIFLFIAAKISVCWPELLLEPLKKVI